MPINGPSAQIIEIQDRQALFGQEVLNRYWYRLDSLANVNASNVATEFIDTVIAGVIFFQNEALVHLDVTVINHSDPTVFGTFTSNVAGLGGSTDLLPPFASVGIRLNRASRELRNGQKRIAGLAEANQVDGIFTSAFLTVVATNAPAITDTLVDGAQNFVPVIVRNRPTKNDPSVDPDDATTWKFVFISGLTIKNAVTTQNSRKF